MASHCDGERSGDTEMGSPAICRSRPASFRNRLRPGPGAAVVQTEASVNARDSRGAITGGIRRGRCRRLRKRDDIL